MGRAATDVMQSVLSPPCSTQRAEDRVERPYQQLLRDLQSIHPNDLRGPAEGAARTRFVETTRSAFTQPLLEGYAVAAPKQSRRRGRWTAWGARTIGPVTAGALRGSAVTGLAGRQATGGLGGHCVSRRVPQGRAVELTPWRLSAPSSSGHTSMMSAYTGVRRLSRFRPPASAGSSGPEHRAEGDLNVRHPMIGW